MLSWTVLVKAILANYGCLDDLDYSVNNVRLTGTVTFEFGSVKAKCLVYADLDADCAVSLDAVNDLVDERNRRGLNKAFYITASSFSQDVKQLVNDINLILLDKEYIEDHWLDIMMCISDADYDSLEKTPKSTSSRKKLKVTFPDGTVFCDFDTGETLIQAIRYIGVEKAASAGLTVSREPLLTRNVNPKYAKYYKPIEDDWYITLQSDTGIRMRQLLALNIRLNLDIKVEEGTGFVVKTKASNRKRNRQYLLVDFEDGTLIGGDNQTESFIEAVQHIGVSKIKNLTWRDEPIVSSYKSNKYQVQLGTGEWLTVPNSTKEKYKMLAVISACTQIKMKLAIK